MLYSIFKKQFLGLAKLFKKLDTPRLEKEVYPEEVNLTVHDYLPSENEFHKFNLYKNINIKEPKPLIIDIHGGAWVYGTKDLKRAFCSSFAYRGYDVISLSYRLIDEVMLEDQIKDIFECLNYIYINKDNLDISFDNVFITGDSAGGHLALVTSKIISDPVLANELGIKLPSFKVNATLINHPVPYTDIAGTLVGKPILSKLVSIPGIKRIFYGKNYKDNIFYQKLVNPEVYINKDTKLPKLLLLTSKKDTLYHYQSDKLNNYLNSIGFNFEYYCEDDKEGIHVFNSIYPYSNIGIKANNFIDNFFKKHMN